MNEVLFTPAAGETRVADDVLAAGKALRRAGRFSKLALLAARAACAQKNFDAPLGLIVGTALGPHEATSQVQNDMMDFGDAGISPTAFSHSVHNVAAAYIAQTLGITGPCLTVTDFEDIAARCRELAQCWIASNTCHAVLVVVVDEAGFVFDRVAAKLGEPFAGVRESARAFTILKGTE